MRAGVKPLAMAGVAVVGAGLIAASPALPVPPALAKAQVSNAAVQLAANSVANIPTNLFRIMMDMPKNQLAGLQAATASLELSGDWWIYTPTNVLGWDQADWAKALGFTSMLTPIPEVAKAQADQINAIMVRNFPMTYNCTGAPQPCADPFYFAKYFSTPLNEALFGYSTTYGDVYNSLDPNIKMPWSNSTLTYDPLGPGKALWDALTKDPDPNWTYERPYLLDQMEAGAAFGKAVFNSFNPFVDGTFCLPCQLFVKGAPSSLPVVGIFGNYYTYLDFGQQFTDEDWVGPHPEIPVPDHVNALSLYTPEAWERIGKDAKTWFKWITGQGPAVETDYGNSGQTLPAVPDTTPPIPEGLAGDLPASVLTIKGTEIWPINDYLQGKVCDGSLGDCNNMDYIQGLQEFSIQDGYRRLTDALADPAGGPTTVYAYSEGAVVATRWLNDYSKALAKAQAAGKTDVEGAPSADNLHFILLGNPDRKYGGTRPAWFIERSTTDTTKYVVLDVSREYDPASDLPTDQFNLLAMMNAASAYFVIHANYQNVDLNDPTNVVFQEGNTTYVLSRTKNLPMLEGLRQLGLNTLADQLQAKLKPIIDSAYDRDYPNVITDPADAADAVARAKAGLPPSQYASTQHQPVSALASKAQLVADSLNTPPATSQTETPSTDNGGSSSGTDAAAPSAADGTTAGHTPDANSPAGSDDAPAKPKKEPKDRPSRSSTSSSGQSNVAGGSDSGTGRHSSSDNSGSGSSAGSGSSDGSAKDSGGGRHRAKDSSKSGGDSGASKSSDKAA